MLNKTTAKPLSKTDRKILYWRNSRTLRHVIAHSMDRRERQLAKYAAAKAQELQSQAVEKCTACKIELIDDVCPACGVHFGESCPECGESGFHSPNCSEVEESTRSPQERLLDDAQDAAERWSAAQLLCMFAPTTESLAARETAQANAKALRTVIPEMDELERLAAAEMVKLFMSVR